MTANAASPESASVGPREVLAGLDLPPARVALLGWIVAGLFFVVFFAWAAVARLDAAAQGQGQVSVVGNRQTVQQRDGGVIAALDVREGEHVRTGQVLIRLAGDEVRAQDRSLASSVINLQAQDARLEAEIAGRAIAWPVSFANLPAEDREIAEKAKQLQLDQYRARHRSLSAEHDVLDQQEAQLRAQASGDRAQSTAAAGQRDSYREQLEAMQPVADKGFISKNQIRTLQRSITEMDGAEADYRSRAAAAGEQIGQSRDQFIQSQRKYVEDSAGQLRDDQFQLNDLVPKLSAAREQLARTLIRAPVAGRVVDLRVFTQGGVITPGQPILDIVPDAAPLVIKAQFDPTDIDGVGEGMAAEVRFLSFHERDLPILKGIVRNVSADTLHDDKTGKSFYTADIVVPHDQLVMLAQARGTTAGLRPGIPVQATVRVRARTALAYLFEPLGEAVSHSFHQR
ncbi:HlyD family type I secretion periplasmic adaptor subunit [Sphingomonas koreensis]|nr:HlyD family type I secretion periplasmic adaptor subunit [Sphingomonas koreensis]